MRKEGEWDNEERKWSNCHFFTLGVGGESDNNLVDELLDDIYLVLLSYYHTFIFNFYKQFSLKIEHVYKNVFILFYLFINHFNWLPVLMNEFLNIIK